mmetsp:Transcript_82954/g.253525  ORF Transcript_82954/g.253525 Transcript_82954/m.253525 type:complete len:259 (+) Transcript_82954:408-1184(+)
MSCKPCSSSCTRAIKSNTCSCNAPARAATCCSKNSTCSHVWPILSRSSSISVPDMSLMSSSSACTCSSSLHGGAVPLLLATPPPLLTTRTFKLSKTGSSGVSRSAATRFSASAKRGAAKWSAKASTIRSADCGGRWGFAGCERLSSTHNRSAKLVSLSAMSFARDLSAKPTWSSARASANRDCCPSTSETRHPSAWMAPAPAARDFGAVTAAQMAPPEPLPAFRIKPCTVSARLSTWPCNSAHRAPAEEAHATSSTRR